MKGSPPVQRSLIQTHFHLYKERTKQDKEAESGIIWAWLKWMYTDTSINRTVKKTCTSWLVCKIVQAQLPYFHSQHSFLLVFKRRVFVHHSYGLKNLLFGYESIAEGRL